MHEQYCIFSRSRKLIQAQADHVVLAVLVDQVGLSDLLDPWVRDQQRAFREDQFFLGALVDPLGPLDHEGNLSSYHLLQVGRADRAYQEDLQRVFRRVLAQI